MQKFFVERTETYSRLSRFFGVPVSVVNGRQVEARHAPAAPILRRGFYEDATGRLTYIGGYGGYGKTELIKKITGRLNKSKEPKHTVFVRASTGLFQSGEFDAASFLKRLANEIIKETNYELSDFRRYYRHGIELIPTPTDQKLTWRIILVVLGVIATPVLAVTEYGDTDGWLRQNFPDISSIGAAIITVLLIAIVTIAGLKSDLKTLGRRIRGSWQSHSDKRVYGATLADFRDPSDSLSQGRSLADEPEVLAKTLLKGIGSRLKNSSPRNGPKVPEDDIYICIDFESARASADSRLEKVMKALVTLSANDPHIKFIIVSKYQRLMNVVFPDVEKQNLQTLELTSLTEWQAAAIATNWLQALEAEPAGAEIGSVSVGGLLQHCAQDIRDLPKEISDGKSDNLTVKFLRLLAMGPNRDPVLRPDIVQSRLEHFSKVYASMRWDAFLSALRLESAEPTECLKDARRVLERLRDRFKQIDPRPVDKLIAANSEDEKERNRRTICFLASFRKPIPTSFLPEKEVLEDAGGNSTSQLRTMHPEFFENDEMSSSTTPEFRKEIADQVRLGGWHCREALESLGNFFRHNANVNLKLSKESVERRIDERLVLLRTFMVDCILSLIAGHKLAQVPSTPLWAAGLPLSEFLSDFQDIFSKRAELSFSKVTLRELEESFLGLVGGLLGALTENSDPEKKELHLLSFGPHRQSTVRFVVCAIERETELIVEDDSILEGLGLIYRSGCLEDWKGEWVSWPEELQQLEEIARKTLIRLERLRGYEMGSTTGTAPYSVSLIPDDKPGDDAVVGYELSTDEAIGEISKVYEDRKADREDEAILRRLVGMYAEFLKRDLSGANDEQIVKFFAIARKVANSLASLTLNGKILGEQGITAGHCVKHAQAHFIAPMMEKLETCVGRSSGVEQKIYWYLLRTQIYWLYSLRDSVSCDESQIEQKRSVSVIDELEKVVYEGIKLSDEDYVLELVSDTDLSSAADVEMCIRIYSAGYFPLPDDPEKLSASKVLLLTKCLFLLREISHRQETGHADWIDESLLIEATAKAEAIFEESLSRPDLSERSLLNLLEELEVYDDFVFEKLREKLVSSGHQHVTSEIASALGRLSDSHWRALDAFLAYVNELHDQSLSAARKHRVSVQAFALSESHPNLDVFKRARIRSIWLKTLYDHWVKYCWLQHMEIGKEPCDAWNRAARAFTVADFDKVDLSQEILKLLSTLNPLERSSLRTGVFLVAELKEFTDESIELLVAGADYELNLPRNLASTQLYHQWLAYKERSTDLAVDERDGDSKQYVLVQVRFLEDSEGRVPVTCRGNVFVARGVQIFMPFATKWETAEPKKVYADDLTLDDEDDTRIAFEKNDQKQASADYKWSGNIWLGASNSCAVVRLDQAHKSLLLAAGGFWVNATSDLLGLRRLVFFQKARSATLNGIEARRLEIRHFVNDFYRALRVKFDDDHGVVCFPPERGVNLDVNKVRTFLSMFRKVFGREVRVADWDENATPIQIKLTKLKRDKSQEGLKDWESLSFQTIQMLSLLRPNSAEEVMKTLAETSCTIVGADIEEILGIINFERAMN